MTLLVVALSMIAGCTFSPGAGFATIDSATFSAALVPGDARDLGDDTVLTDLAYHVELTTLTAQIDGIELLELQGGAGGTFDPASPPPGYTLCHGGHCHADDGSLVAYAEIEAELAGGNATFEPVVSLPLEAELDLLSGETLELTASPTDELPEARISLARLNASRLGAMAEVTEGELTEPVTLSVDFPLSPVDGGIELVVDRDFPARVALDVDWTVDGTLFDGIDFASIAVDGAASLTDPTSTVGDVLWVNLSNNVPTVAAAEAE